MKSSKCELGLKQSSDNKTNCISEQICFFSSPAKTNGPFGSLSETVQRSAVEVLFHLPTLDGELFKVIVTCCQGGHVSVSVVKYILQVLHYRFVKS